MFTKHVTIREAQANFDELCDVATSEQGVILISPPTGEDLALIAATELSALTETLYLLGSKNNAMRLLSALQRATHV